MKRQKSPCIDICEFSGPKGWCIGCGRTRGECRKWKTLKPYAVKSLRKELIKRMEQMTRLNNYCLLYTSPSPRDVEESRMPSSA